MIELSANIDIYNTTNEYTSATLLNSPSLDITTKKGIVYSSRDISSIFEDKNVNLFRYFVNAKDYFDGINEDILTIEENETIGVSNTGFPCVAPIVKIEYSENNVEPIYFRKTPYSARRIIILNNTTYSLNRGGRLVETGRTIKFSNKIYKEYILNLSYIPSDEIKIYDFTIISFAPSDYLAFSCQLNNASFILVYTTASVTGLTMDVRLMCAHTKEIVYDNKLPLEENSNQITYMLEDFPPYSWLMVFNDAILKSANIDINLNNAKQLEIENSDREDYKLPQFGLISSGSSLEFFDTENVVEQYYNWGLLTKNKPLTQYIYNTLTKHKEKLATYNTTQFEYSNLKRICRVSYDDGLTKLQDIQVEAINYDARHPQSKTAYWFLNQISYYLPFSKNIDSETMSVLQSTYVPYPYLESSNAWDSLNKICTLCQLHGYVDKNGELVLKYNGGN